MKRVIASLAIGMLIGSATVAAAAPNTVQATIAKFKILVDGETKTGTTSQLVYNGTTYVPIREVGGLFGYETEYDGTNKSIEFVANNEVSSKWTTFVEFSTLNDLVIRQDQDSKDVLNIMDGGNIIFSININATEYGAESSITTRKGDLIKILNSYGSILLNKSDLKAAGFKI